ncbi:CAP domain-containing protein [Patescibacteria group bacterium]|nr:CAP domain-containing protein [Patescibacteria group bacterium]
MSRGITDFAKKTKNRLTYRSAVSLRTAKSYFIPHEDNAHKPFIIRPGALRFYSIVLIITKLAVTGFMYASYPSPAFFSSASSTNIVNLTNSSRQANGMTDLDVSEELNLAAYQKAQDMVNNNYFSHESPSGARFWNWIIGAGYQYTTAGENLAMDFNSAEAVHNALMASATHRKNILNANFTEVGISIISGKINGKDTTVLVEMFGNPKVAVVAPEPEPQPVPEPTPEPTPPPPQNVNSATTNTAPEPQPAPEPVYTAEIVSKMDDSLNIKTAEEVEYWVDIKNTGNTTWLSSGDNFVALNVTDPAGKESLFAYSSWLEKYRPTKLTDNIAPNETARFSFMLKAPIEANVYEESFQLVAENITWIDGSYFKLPITVVKPVPVNTNVAAPVNQNSNNAVTQPNFVATTNSNLSIVPADTEVTPFVIAASNTVKEPKDFLNYLNKYSNIIFWTILILVAIALSISTVVKFRIQHASTVIPSLLVILLASLMLFMRFHFIQNLGSQPIIL